MERKLIGFMATPEQIEKMRLLASGENLSMSEVLRRLVDLVPVKPVVSSGLMIDTSAIAQSLATSGNSGLAVNP